MINVLIVEDELLTRIGIESMLPWEHYGFTVAGVAENGQQGLKMAMDLQPDIIITDVMMPVLNGIELMKSVKHSGLNARFIILSAYDEFAYVKEALRLGAVDYLLKLDIEPELLLEALEKAKKELPELSGEQSEKRSIAATWKDKALCISRILEGSDPLKALQACDLDFPEKNLICIYSKDMLSPNELLQVGFYPNIQTIVCTLNELLAHFGTAYGFPVKNQYFFHLLTTNRKYSSMEQVELSYEIQNVLHDYFLKSFNIALSVEVSKQVQSFAEISEVFNAMIADSSARKDQASQPLIEIGPLKDALSTRSPEDTRLFFDSLLRDIQERHLDSREQLYHICYSLISTVDSFIAGNPLYKADWDISAEIDFISRKCTDTHEFLTFIKVIKERLLRILSAADQTNQLVLKVKDYLESHYSSPDITLEMVAAEVYASPNYLCRICSRELGKTPIQYLTEIRMRHAKQLLVHTGGQVKDISRQVGYKNPYYFSRIFKKHTGMTPQEYRSRA